MAQEVRDYADINRRLEEISREILPEGIVLRWIAVDDLKEQDLNAQSMPYAMFNQLVSNIAGAGTLESLPLCAEVEGAVEIVSGHHRVRAARAANLSHVLCLVYLDIDRSAMAAKQLAHNTIFGTSDPTVVAQIWSRIHSIAHQFEAFVDPRVLEVAPKPVSFQPVDVDLTRAIKRILLVFLPSQLVDIEQALALLPLGDADEVWLAHRDQFEEWQAALEKVRADLEIRSIPAAVAEMARMTLEALSALEDMPND